MRDVQDFASIKIKLASLKLEFLSKGISWFRVKKMLQLT